MNKGTEIDTTFWQESVKGKGISEDLDVDGRIILR
jgi:hypothetical protein